MQRRGHIAGLEVRNRVPNLCLGCLFWNRETLLWKPKAISGYITITNENFAPVPVHRGIGRFSEKVLGIARGSFGKKHSYMAWTKKGKVAI